MNHEQRAVEVVTKTVLSIENEEGRREFARQLIAHSIATLVFLDGAERAAEFVYRAADATVGVA